MEFVSTFCVHVWYVDLVLTCRNVMSRLLAFMVFSQVDTDAVELGVWNTTTFSKGMGCSVEVSMAMMVMKWEVSVLCDGCIDCWKQSGQQVVWFEWCIVSNGTFLRDIREVATSGRALAMGAVTGTCTSANAASFQADRTPFRGAILLRSWILTCRVENETSKGDVPQWSWSRTELPQYILCAVKHNLGKRKLWFKLICHPAIDGNDASLSTFGGDIDVVEYSEYD